MKAHHIFYFIKICIYFWNVGQCNCSENKLVTFFRILVLCHSFDARHMHLKKYIFGYFQPTENNPKWMPKSFRIKHPLKKYALCSLLIILSKLAYDK